LKNKKIRTYLIILTSIFILCSTSAYAQHYIIGTVNDAGDSTKANGATVICYTPGDESLNDTDIVGPTGFSGVDNEYMCDVEVFNENWNIGDNISSRVIDNGSGYVAGPVNTTLTGAAADAAPDMTLTIANTAPTVDSVLLEDSDLAPSDELDLTAGSTTFFNCTGTVTDTDGTSDIDNVKATLFHNLTRNATSPDNDTNHYTNESCNVTTLDTDTLNYTCSFNVEFYATSGLWNCNITVNDTSGINDSKIDNATVTELVAIDVEDSTINFGSMNVNTNTGATDIAKNITNQGNTDIDLNLNVYGDSFSDNISMNCSTNSINASFLKWSLTAGTNYASKSSSVSDSSGINIANFNLFSGPASNKTLYFGMGIPSSPIVSGTCQGTTSFLAIANS